MLSSDQPRMASTSGLHTAVSPCRPGPFGAPPDVGPSREAADSCVRPASGSSAPRPAPLSSPCSSASVRVLTVVLAAVSRARAHTHTHATKCFQLC